MASIARSLRPMAARLSLRSSSSLYRPASIRSSAFSMSSTMQAKKYTKDHEWVELSADQKTGVIGISKYAANALGDVVYVELPTVGSQFEAGDAIGAVESVKSASDINTPVTCTITDVNSALEERPNAINKDDAEDASSNGGWVSKIEVGAQGVQDLAQLMDEAAYKAFTDEEH